MLLLLIVEKLKNKQTFNLYFLIKKYFNVFFLNSLNKIKNLIYLKLN